MDPAAFRRAQVEKSEPHRPASDALVLQTLQAALSARGFELTVSLWNSNRLSVGDLGTVVGKPSGAGHRTRGPLRRLWPSEWRPDRHRCFAH